MTSKLQFLGGYQSVTGSKTLYSARGRTYLIDCGLFQGVAELRQMNRESLPIAAPSIHAVLLTHAHLDHCGYLPKLYRDGFRGPIYCTQGTAQLAEIILKDSAKLEEEQAAYARSTGYSRHKNPEPLFTMADVEHVIQLFEPLQRHQWITIDPDISIRLLRAGHITGSSLIQVMSPSGDGFATVTFSGDLGHDRSFIFKGPDTLPETDVLVLESTYGNRLHPRENTLQTLGGHLQTVLGRGGVAVFPAFAVGRSQEVIQMIAQLERDGVIPRVPVLLDSPMAQRATEIFLRQTEDNLPAEFFPEHFRTVTDANDSMLACMMDGPAIVVSASGMLSGGRILHHLRRRLPDPRNMVLFTGYQAEGTKGRYLQDQGAASGSMRIFHEEVAVRATIVRLDALSAHADYQDMLDWLKRAPRLPRQILLNHGEAEAQRRLAQHLREELKVPVQASVDQQEFALG